MILPPPIQTYFDSEASGNVDALVRAFTAEGVVADEGRTHTGRAAIEAWRREAMARYQAVIEPVEASSWDQGAQVLARVTGNFPGSPITLRFTFDIESDLIARLEIGA